jgi:hypothetical protein
MEIERPRSSRFQASIMRRSGRGPRRAEARRGSGTIIERDGTAPTYSGPRANHRRSGHAELISQARRHRRLGPVETGNFGVVVDPPGLAAKSPRSIATIPSRGARSMGTWCLQGRAAGHRDPLGPRLREVGPEAPRPSKRQGGGHIAIVVGRRDQNGNLMCLGGNQEDAVNIKPFTAERPLSLPRGCAPRRESDSAPSPRQIRWERVDAGGLTGAASKKHQYVLPPANSASAAAAKPGINPL